jgi:hypothetical protein
MQGKEEVHTLHSKSSFAICACRISTFVFSISRASIATKSVFSSDVPIETLLAARIAFSVFTLSDDSGLSCLISESMVGIGVGGSTEDDGGSGVKVC